jgi:MFS transporter, UMF1 family
MSIKNNPRIIRAWCMYDWANSVYSLNITSSIFPAYYQAVTKNTSNLDKVNFLGFQLANSVLYSYAIAFAFLCVVLLSPILGGIADRTGNKKAFMKFFCTIGSLACMGLFFFTGENIEWGISMLILATIGYAGSLVFYNSYLPEITTPDMSDKVSAKGFSYGYVGSVILLVFNLTMLLLPEYFWNISSEMASRISFLMVGVWWLGFAQYSFRILPETTLTHTEQTNHFISVGFLEIQNVFRQLKDLVLLKRFLLAFFLYSMGVQTVMLVATLLGEKEFHLQTGELIATVLILQIVAIFGANIAARVSLKIGNIKTLILIVSVWTIICLMAYFMQNGTHFYILAVFVGLVMGAIQALSRSTYSKMIPADSTDHASFFSFYDVTEKLSTVLGMFSYAFIEQLTGTMRNSVLAVGLFFIFGLIVLLNLKSVAKS